MYHQLQNKISKEEHSSHCKVLRSTTKKPKQNQNTNKTPSTRPESLVSRKLCHLMVKLLPHAWLTAVT